MAASRSGKLASAGRLGYRRRSPAHGHPWRRERGHLNNPSFGDMHMSEQLTLSAETRELAGKGASRAMRREGRVPAVVYGNKEEPLAIHVEEKALVKML